jgi:hypothetical protein
MEGKCSSKAAKGIPESENACITAESASQGHIGGASVAQDRME